MALPRYALTNLLGITCKGIAHSLHDLDDSQDARQDTVPTEDPGDTDRYDTIKIGTLDHVDWTSVTDLLLAVGREARSNTPILYLLFRSQSPGFEEQRVALEWVDYDAAANWTITLYDRYVGSCLAVTHQQLISDYLKVCHTPKTSTAWLAHGIVYDGNDEMFREVSVEDNDEEVALRAHGIEKGKCEFCRKNKG